MQLFFLVPNNLGEGGERRRDFQSPMLTLMVAAVGAVGVPMMPIESSVGVSDVVFTLIRSDEDASTLIERGKCLRRALGVGPKYDQVFFHDGELLAAKRSQLQASLPDVRLVDAQQYGGFSSPDPLSMDEQDMLVSEKAPLGYRHMCQFMSMRWFRALANYELSMRVDEDVCIQRFAANPFQAMRSDGLVYMYGLQVPRS